VERINSATAYDQVKVKGNVTLGSTPNNVGPTLNVILGYTPNETPFEIIDLYDSTYHVQGTFGTAVFDFAISYAGGDSNKDVILTWIFFGGGG
jgi:hypothetical protein